MPSGTLPEVDASTRPEDIQQAGAWLAGHGLVGAPPTPLLAARLAARRRARRADNIMLAGLVLVASLVQANDRLAASGHGGFGPYRLMSLLVLMALMVGLLLVQARLDWWVRRVDRRAGATLSRRATHPVQPGWRAVLGWPRAAFAVTMFVGTMVLAVSALTSGDSIVRYAAIIALVGLFGVTVGAAVQLRDLLVRPVVAEDEVSLTADVIMRVEDARELTTPWSLPVVLLFAATPGWWNVAAFIFAVLGAVTLVVIHKRTPPSAMVARRAMIAR